MHKKTLQYNLEKITRQRDFFLSLSMIVVFSNTMLALKIVISDEKIIMMPGLSQEVTLSNKTVSASYLEEMSQLFLSHLLDINGANIEYKRELILKNCTTTDQKSLKDIQKYFSDTEKEYKKFDLATYFTVKDMEIDADELKVITSGILTSTYGKRGVSSKEAKYLLRFEYQAGRLRLKSFEGIEE